MRIIFLGTPEFAVPSLEILIGAGYKPIAVATAPDKPRGRGQKLTSTPVKKVALTHTIPILQPESVRDPAFARRIRELKPDLLVVVAFRILPTEVFTTATMGAFNLHASLLPAFRGAAPINRAIMAGAEETGVTTFFLKEKVDTGNIILQKSLEVGPDETAGELHDRLMRLGAVAVKETVDQIAAGSVVTSEQDEALATKAPKIFKDDARIPWEHPAADVHNHIRGLSPYPGAWTVHGSNLIKIYRSKRSDRTGRPGEVLESKERLRIACGKESVEILKLQQEGRRRLPAADWLRGYALEVGTILG